MTFGKMFFDEFWEYPSSICFGTKTIWRTDHIILCLCLFFLFVLVSAVFGINVMLSWKPLFLSESEYIGIDSLKTTWLEEIFEIRSATALGISLIIVRGWFDFLLMYTGVLSGFLYGRYVTVSKFISTSRKLIILRLVCNCYV